jgi:hypothetical protein
LAVENGSALIVMTNSHAVKNVNWNIRDNRTVNVKNETTRAPMCVGIVTALVGV